MRDPRGGASNRAGGSQDQHSFSRLNSGDVHHRSPGRQVGDSHAGRLFVAQVFRKQGHTARRNRDELRVAAITAQAEVSPEPKTDLPRNSSGPSTTIPA